MLMVNMLPQTEKESLEALELELSKMRFKLNKLAEAKDFDFQDMELLTLSRKLDTLIVRYYKKLHLSSLL